ncbi:MAG: hypothetical protein LBL04_12095 [Bacteroidales bacterium]|jgi:hypothetical protein|nr:hypothetical protein [Bacteroidales bacterium]
MNRLKCLSVLFAAVLAGVVFVACSKDDDKPGEAGKEAGEAMCGCVSGYEVPEDFAAFMAYAEQLYNCLATIAPYSEYIELAGDVDNSYGYDPEAENPLYSVFAFTNADFEKEFKKATEVCMSPFQMLFDLLMPQGDQE